MERDAVSSICGLICMGIITRLATKSIGPMFSGIEGLQVKMVLKPAQALFVRAPGDEASVILTVSQLLNWISLRIVNLPARMLRVGESVIGRLFRSHQINWKLLAKKSLRIGPVFLIAGIEIWYLVERLTKGALFFSNVILDALASAVIGFAMIFAMLCVLWILAVALPLVTGLGFYLALMTPIVVMMSAVAVMTVGPEIVLSPLALEITAEPTPPGQWTLVQLALREADEAGATVLQHSRPYQSKEAIQRVCEWIRERSRTGA
jgi:hypothetical protein